VFVDQGNLPGALNSYRNGLGIRDELAKADPGNAGLQEDLSVSYDRVGNVLVAQGNLSEALKSYRDSLAIRDPLAKSDPSNAGWQHDLSVSYDKVGDVLRAQGNLPEALKSYGHSLAIRQMLVAKDASNAQWQKDLQFSVGRIGGMAFSFVLAGKFDQALQSADEAISLAPDKVWLYANRAHALMFLGRQDEARTLYLRYRDEKNVQNGKSWKPIIVEDFAEMRKAGLMNPLMEEIAKLFAN
jgi:tetratricopeptide (TPR) repeat protein